MEELKAVCEKMRSEFLDGAQAGFQKDYEMLTAKYDLEMRELDQAINRRESLSGGDAGAARFRFDTVDRIRSLEEEKAAVRDALQERHKVALAYELVACEVIRT